jgi:hypothetical protein
MGLCDRNYGVGVVSPPPLAIGARRNEIVQKLRELADRLDAGEEIPVVECEDVRIGISDWTIYSGERSA